jgi:aspartate/methionine/tyrosine aminotransferase
MKARTSVGASLLEQRARFQAQRTERFVESVIREMSRIAIASGAVNLAQGFPDFPAPANLKAAAAAAIDADFNQYPVTWGIKPLRDAIAARFATRYGLTLDPDQEVTVVCGSTEGMIATLLATVNEDEEVIVFEPFYENYFPDTLLCGAQRRLVKLRAPDWSFDRDELRRAFNERTKAIIINTPNNPTGKVFSRDELEFIAGLCQEFDALAITDEIYEYITYDGREHVPIMCLPGMRDRTILINSMSKTYSVTGWRVGWMLAAPDLSASLRKVHDFLTVGAPHPLQVAGVAALQMPEDYYAGLAGEYQGKRDLLLRLLREAGLQPLVPNGAYYILVDIRSTGFSNDIDFVRHLIEKIGVAAVPGSSFLEDPRDGHHLIRFCYCKKPETLEEAGRRLRKLVS